MTEAQVKMIRDGLFMNDADFVVDVFQQAPMIVIGNGHASINDKDLVDGILWHADEWRANGLRQRCKLPISFLVIASDGGQYGNGVQEALKRARPTYQWFFPADAPEHWDGIQKSAVWLAEWLAKNNFAKKYPR